MVFGIGGFITAIVAAQYWETKRILHFLPWVYSLGGLAIISLVERIEYDVIEAMVSAAVIHVIAWIAYLEERIRSRQRAKYENRHTPSK